MHTANFLFATIFVLAGNVKAASLPDAIIQQFPSDHAALTYKEGDFNSDNKLDFVVVLRHKDEDKMIEQNLDTPPRPLLVFIQKNRNDYILVARNDNVVYTINEGGQCDQFMSNDEGLAVKVLFSRYKIPSHADITGQITLPLNILQLNKAFFHKRVAEEWRIGTQNTLTTEALQLYRRNVTAALKGSPVMLQNFRPSP